jgi:hypothetical protein
VTTRIDAILMGIRILIFFCGVAAIIFALIGPSGMPSVIPPGIDKLIPKNKDQP